VLPSQGGGQNQVPGAVLRGHCYWLDLLADFACADQGESSELTAPEDGEEKQSLEGQVATLGEMIGPLARESPSSFASRRCDWMRRFHDVPEFVGQWTCKPPNMFPVPTVDRSWNSKPSNMSPLSCSQILVSAGTVQQIIDDNLRYDPQNEGHKKPSDKSRRRKERLPFKNQWQL
jgi:hypothetical protein